MVISRAAETSQHRCPQQSYIRMHTLRAPARPSPEGQGAAACRPLANFSMAILYGHLMDTLHSPSDHNTAASCRAPRIALQERSSRPNQAYTGTHTPSLCVGSWSASGAHRQGSPSQGWALHCP